MYCSHCGTAMPKDAAFCAACGQPLAQKQTPVFMPQQCSKGGRIGFSENINDPAFAKYLKNSNRWAGIFSVIIAIAAIIGFYIAGETSTEMDNPESLYIGLGIGGMFLVIALFTVIGRKRSRTWDGSVIDKTVKKKSRRRDTGNDDSYVEYYTEYTVAIRENGGKVHRLVHEDDDTIFNYYRIGDRVRHHAGLKSYEKHDKTQDSIIFCNACGTLCDINDDVCFRCKCPLLK